MGRTHGRPTSDTVTPKEREQLSQIKASTKDVYERQATFWHNHRSRSLYEKAWLDRFIAFLRPGARLLDLGCGSGEPIARYLLANEFEVVGVDYSRQMIRIAETLLPDAEWLVGDMRALPTAGPFEGICGWDSFFHLSVEEQRAVLPELCELIRPGGVLLVTVGAAEDEVTGYVGNDPVYHASLSPAEYEEILRGNGFNDITYAAQDHLCKGRSILLASGRS